MALHAYIVFSLYAGLLMIVRVLLTGDTLLGGLIWNLILALVPYFFALLAIRYRSWRHYVFLLGWLLFFPNALYIFTDFIHLGRDMELIHFDIVLIATTALAGLIAGFASLELLHTYWNRHVHKTLAWVYVTLAFIVALFGVYIGRFLRWNSWDILHHPLDLMFEIFRLLTSPNQSLQITDTERALESSVYGAHPLNVYIFIALYFGLYMILYVFLYHTRKVR